MIAASADHRQPQRRSGMKYVGPSYPGDVLHCVQIGSTTMVLILNPDHPVRVMRKKGIEYVIEEWNGSTY